MPNLGASFGSLSSFRQCRSCSAERRKKTKARRARFRARRGSALLRELTAPLFARSSPKRMFFGPSNGLPRRRTRRSTRILLGDRRELRRENRATVVKRPHLSGEIDSPCRIPKPRGPISPRFRVIPPPGTSLDIECEALLRIRRFRLEAMSTRCYALTNLVPGYKRL